MSTDDKATDRRSLRGDPGNRGFMMVLKFHRPPFFSDPRDAYQAALEYIELTRVKTAEELLAEFGCTWDEYVPVSVG